MSDTAPLSNTAAAVAGNAQAVEKSSAAKSQAWRDNEGSDQKNNSGFTGVLSFSDLFQTLQVPAAVLPIAGTAAVALESDALSEVTAVTVADRLPLDEQSGDSLPFLSMDKTLATASTVKDTVLAQASSKSVSVSIHDKAVATAASVSEGLVKDAALSKNSPLNLDAISGDREPSAQLKSAIEAARVQLSTLPTQQSVQVNQTAQVTQSTQSEIDLDLEALHVSKRHQQSNTLVQADNKVNVSNSKFDANKDSALARMSEPLSSVKPTSVVSQHEVKRADLSSSITQFSQGVALATQRVSAQVQGSAMQYQRLSSAQFNQQNSAAMLDSEVGVMKGDAAKLSANLQLNNTGSANGVVNSDVGQSTALSKSLLLSSMQSERKMSGAGSRTRMDTSVGSMSSSGMNSEFGRLSENQIGFGLQADMRHSVSGSTQPSRSVQASLQNSHWFGNMAEKVAAQLSSSRGSVQLQLEPEALGKLDIQMAAGQMLSIKSTNPEVQSFIDSQLLELEQAFEKVKLSSDTQFSSTENHQHEQSENHAQSQNETQSGFGAAMNDEGAHALSQNLRDSSDSVRGSSTDASDVFSERQINFNDGRRLNLFA